MLEKLCVTIWMRKSILFSALLLKLLCFQTVTAEHIELGKVIVDMTKPLNEVISGNISKSNFSRILDSNPVFGMNNMSTSGIEILYDSDCNILEPEQCSQQLQSVAALCNERIPRQLTIFLTWISLHPTTKVGFGYSEVTMSCIENYIFGEVVNSADFLVLTMKFGNTVGVTESFGLFQKRMDSLHQKNVKFIKRYESSFYYGTVKKTPKSIYYPTSSSVGGEAHRRLLLKYAQSWVTSSEVDDQSIIVQAVYFEPEIITEYSVTTFLNNAVNWFQDYRQSSFIIMSASSPQNQGESPQEGSTLTVNSTTETGKVIPSNETESIKDTKRKLGLVLPQEELCVDLQIHQEIKGLADTENTISEQEAPPPFKYFTFEDENTLWPMIESKSNKLFDMVTRLIINQKTEVMKTLASKGGWIPLNKENPRVLLRHLKRIPPPPLLSMAPEISPNNHAFLAWPANGVKFGEEKMSKLLLVFEAGWKRETVIRSCGPKGQKTSVVHYYSPTRIMLRSAREVEKWLEENEPGSPFTLDNFSFDRVRISKDPDEEIVREMFPLKPPAPSGRALVVKEPQRPPALRLSGQEITDRMFMELTNASNPSRKRKISSIPQSKLTSTSSSLRKPGRIRRSGLSPLTPRVRTAFQRLTGGCGTSLFQKFPVSPTPPYALSRVNAAFPRLQRKWLANKSKRRGVSKGKPEKTVMTLKPVIMAAPLLAKKVAFRQQKTTMTESSSSSSNDVTGRVFKISAQLHTQPASVSTEDAAERVEQFEVRDLMEHLKLM
ncbi:unnamed protein product [Orchesella dallaii]|uniref:MBD domain-containing protein n=1 Tax=Orchesella dallaii TaxID=48710 RepID=A0ABP1R624_9HEXA